MKFICCNYYKYMYIHKYVYDLLNFPFNTQTSSFIIIYYIHICSNIYKFFRNIFLFLFSLFYFKFETVFVIEHKIGKVPDPHATKLSIVKLEK